MRKIFPKKFLCGNTIYCFLIPFFLLVGGCLELESKLVLNQDGSGRLEVTYILEEEFAATLKETKDAKNQTTTNTINDVIALTGEELTELFQGEGVAVESANFENKDDGLHASYTITFNSFQNFLATKALQTDAVSFYRDKNNNLIFQLETEPTRTNLGAQTISEKAKADIIMVLPGKILDSNADRVEGNTLSWRYTKNKVQPEALKATCEGTGLDFVAQLPGRPKKRKARGYFYDPRGKLDPFKPFIWEIKQAKEDAAKLLQPLQRYEISQLSLVGIIWGIDNPRAMVEDAAGKGYIVTKGTYIGKKGGQVVEILEDEVVVVEESTDIFGEKTINEIRIKLHTGEEERKGK